MGKIYVKASPVSNFSTVQTYNWAEQTPVLGAYDIGSVWTDPPGVYGGFLANFQNPQSTAAGTLTSGVLPNPIYAPQPGMIITAWEPTLGWGEFICLSVPTSTAVPVGTAVRWDAKYSVSTIPTTASPDCALAISISSATSSQVPDATGGGIASASVVQYAWFQITGRAWALKTAVQVTPNASVYSSGTAGRFYVTASTGKAWLGVRAATATTTSTQSAAIVLLNRSVVATQ